MNIDSGPAREYRETVEQEYCKVIIELLNQQEQFEIDQILAEGLPTAKRDELENSSVWEKLHGTAHVIEREVCLCILYYLRKAQHIYNQQMSLVGQAILDYERTRLGLTQATADTINQVLSPGRPLPPPTDQKRLDQYYQHLFIALQRDRSAFNPQQRDVIPLKPATQAELKLLQRVLEIPERDIPPAEMLWTERGINYIRLWELLNRKAWKAANEETLARLIEAGGQPERDLETIDVGRIPLVDLQTIDALWAKASNGRFGFKAQLKLWQEANADPSKPVDFETFGKLVDWRRNNSWIGYSFTDFSDNAVRGHLPTFPLVGWWCWARMESLMKRVETAFAVERTQPAAGSTKPQMTVLLNEQLDESAAA